MGPRGSLRRWMPTASRTPAPRARRVRPPSRRRAGKTFDLGGGGGVEAQNGRSVRDVERFAVGYEILGRIELPDRLRLFQNLVGLQCAIERRNSDGCVASPKKAIGKGPERGDHLLFPQRRSYWTKSGSASASLYRPIRLLAMPPR